jgi:hypothetical protein
LFRIHHKRSAAGDWLTVTWRHVATPNATDFLALMPDGADIRATWPRKLRPTNATCAGRARSRRKSVADQRLTSSAPNAIALMAAWALGIIQPLDGPR